MTLTISVDTGGTHTDAFIWDGRRYATGKADTTGYNLSVGVLKAISLAAQRLDRTLPETLAQAETFRYATTVGTNILVEQSGPKLGLITTRGFEQTIHFGRGRNWADGLPRAKVIDRPRAQRPKPLIPFHLRVGVQERIDCFGNVVMPLHPEDVLARVQYLVDQGVRGFVVSLLFAFANPVHERMIRDIIREQYPDVYLGNMPVLLSSETAPVIDEYRRSITTTLEAYLRPSAERHFLDIQDELRARGYRRPLLACRNTGGVAAVARTRPLHLYGAGAVAGIAGGAYWSQVYGEPNVVLADMGGTSFDVGLILEGDARVYEFRPVLDRWRIALPIIASWSIGSGGGSIARVDEFGRLLVGPESAGAMPGPACYDQGGTEPTVTDADLVLGYLAPDYFLGGRKRLSRRRAEHALRTRVADPLGISVPEAAWRIRTLVDGMMGQEISKQTAMKGLDPRDFLLLAIGGAGPVHAAGIAAAADIPRVATFPFGSVFNAFGAACLDFVQSYERQVRCTLLYPMPGAFTEDYGSFNRHVNEIQAQALRDLQEEGLDLGRVVLDLELDASYAQQIHSTRFASPRLNLAGPDDVAAVCAAFNAAYGRRYGETAIFPEGGVVVSGFHLVARMAVAPPPLAQTGAGASANGAGNGVGAGAGGPGGDRALKGAREVLWSRDAGFVATPVYQRSQLGAGIALTGPVLVEAEDTVVVVPPGWRFRVDQYGNGFLERAVADWARER